MRAKKNKASINIWKESLNKLTSAEPKLLLKGVGTLIIIFSILIIIMGYFNRPISDDYLFHSMNENKNPVAMAIDGYKNGNGRLGQYFMFSLYDHTFGLRRAVMVAPMINTFVLFLAVTFLARQLAKKIKTELSLFETLAISGLITFAMVFSAKSIFDSSLWLDSSVVYLPSLWFIVLEIALIYKILFVDAVLNWKKLALLAGVVVVGQQFSEPNSVFIIGTYFICALYWIMRKNRKNTIVFLTLLSAAISGLLIVFFSPGSQSRQDNYHSKIELYKMLVGSMRYYKTAFELIWTWRLWLFVLVGIVLFYVLVKVVTKRKHAAEIIALGVYLLIVPYYVLFVVSEYSLSGYIALRTYQVPAALAGVGVGLITAGGLLLFRKTIIKYKTYFFLIVSPVVLVAFLTSFRPLVTIIKAEALRSVQYDYRELSIGAQLGQNVKSVYIYPAPILLDDAEPGEFLYRDTGQIDWFEASFKDYYRIGAKQLIVMNNQTAPYCMLGQDMPWWNIEECEQLHLNTKLN